MNYEIDSDEELKEFFKIGSIKPYYSDGRNHSEVYEELIHRYCDLTNEETISLNSLPKFYSTGKYKKKINGKERYIYRNNSFSKLCKNMDESILYKVFYNILSSEVHSTTNEMTKYINEHIMQLCVEINRYLLNFAQKISSTSHLEDNN